MPPSSNTQPALSQDDLRLYVLFKGYDCIGQSNGGYKKFLTACREQQQPWAVEMSAALARVQAATKEISAKISELKSMQEQGIESVCSAVLESNLPPDESPVELGTCVLTGRASTRCFPIQTKNKTPLLVHIRFREFVRNLWLFMRMEQVVKSYTKTFMDSHPGSGPQQLIVEFDALKDDQAAFSGVFLQAYNHTWLSLQTLMNQALASGALARSWNMHIE